jgi:hypothetical protein
MTSRADDYLHKAAEFTDKAETAVDAAGQRAYLNLAESYRLLASKLSTIPTATDSEIEALARRIVQK